MLDVAHGGDDAFPAEAVEFPYDDSVESVHECVLEHSAEFGSVGVCAAGAVDVFADDCPLHCFGEVAEWFELVFWFLVAFLVFVCFI